MAVTDDGKPTDRPVHVCAVCGADAPYGFGDVRKPEAMKWACGAHRAAFEVADQTERLSALAQRQGKLL